MPNRFTSKALIDAIVAGDKFLLSDTSDSGNDKSATIAQLLTLLSANLTHAVEVPNLLNTELTNQSTETQFDSFNTTPSVNTDSAGAVFTAFASDGVTCATGTYFTLVQTYIEGANHAHNTALRISVDGTSGGAIGAQGFIRNVDGHTETGMLVFRLVTLASSAKIGFTHQQIASWANTITMPADNSSMIILRLQE